MHICWPKWRLALFALLVTGATAVQANETARQNDPWESMNRAVFRFNDTLDAHLLKPVSQTYQRSLPRPVQSSVNNFFSNLGEVSNTFNNLLQGKWRGAGLSASRLTLNTTIGLLGLVDVAQAAGLNRAEPESFGQTLSVWGVGPGPYLVLPVLGSSTATDTISLPVDWTLDPVRYMGGDLERLAIKGIEAVDDRAYLLNAEELISGDRYVFIREAYLQRREYLVQDGEITDDFGGDFDDFEDF